MPRANNLYSNVNIHDHSDEHINNNEQTSIEWLVMVGLSKGCDDSRSLWRLRATSIARRLLLSLSLLLLLLFAIEVAVAVEYHLNINS